MLQRSSHLASFLDLTSRSDHSPRRRLISPSAHLQSLDPRPAHLVGHMLPQNAEWHRSGSSFASGCHRGCSITRFPVCPEVRKPRVTGSDAPSLVPRVAMQGIGNLRARRTASVPRRPASASSLASSSDNMGLLLAKLNAKMEARLDRQDSQSRSPGACGANLLGNLYSIRVEWECRAGFRLGSIPLLSSMLRSSQPLQGNLHCPSMSYRL